MINRSLARSAGLATSWQVARAAIQVAWLVLLARLLGVDGYGTFAGTSAMATAASTLVGIGTGLVMLRNVSRDASAFPFAWRRAVGVTAVSGLVLAALLPLAMRSFLGPSSPSWVVLGAIGLTELLALPLIIACSYAFQAHDRMGYANFILVIQPVGSLIAVCVAGILPPSPDTATSLASYAIVHALMAAAAGLVAWWLVRRELAPGRESSGPALLPQLREGAGLSVMRVADTVLSSIDKTLVLRLAGAELAGLYTLAYRVASVLAIPANALAMAAFPRLAAGLGGGRGHGPAHARLLALALGMGALAGVAMWVSAAALPHLMGPGFEPVAEMARRMAATPALLGLSGMACGILLASHRAALRSLVQFGGIALLVALSVYLLSPGEPFAPAIVLQATLAATSISLWAIVLLSEPGHDAVPGTGP